MGTKIIALDVETTGLNCEKAQMIELGAVIYEDGIEVKRFNELIYPSAGLPEKITEITGITGEMLSDARTEQDVMQSFLEFCREYGKNEEEESYLILGHNVIFDYSFLKTAAKRFDFSFECRGIDTLKIARTLHPELKSKTLGAMCNHYHITQDRSHRALDDAIAAFWLYEKMRVRFYEERPEVFAAEQLVFSPKKQEPATKKQMKFLLDLCQTHNLPVPRDYNQLTKSSASRMIDSIILNYGRTNYRNQNSN